jgi:hypothetical protein
MYVKSFSLFTWKTGNMSVYRGASLKRRKILLPVLVAQLFPGSDANPAVCRACRIALFTSERRPNKTDGIGSKNVSYIDV